MDFKFLIKYHKYYNAEWDYSWGTISDVSGSADKLQSFDITPGLGMC